MSQARQNPSPSWLSPENAQFITKGLSITVASRDIRHVPSVSRALACRFAASESAKPVSAKPASSKPVPSKTVPDNSADGSQLVVILSRSQSTLLLADVERSAQVAVVITEPSTHRTLQLKGGDAVVADALEDDLAVVEASRQHFAADILPLGFSGAYNDLLFHHESGDLCRIVFTPTDVFDQTPGVNAGSRIGPAAAGQDPLSP